MDDLMSTWRTDLAAEMADKKDPGPIEAATPPMSDAIYDRPFFHGYGAGDGAPFTAWTSQRVYFPATYDGAEWVASVPRNPCDIATEHIGGG